MEDKYSREEFLQLSGWSVAGTVLGVPALILGETSEKGSGGSGKGKEEMSIQQIIDLLTGSVDNFSYDTTVDTVKTGNPGQRCTGVVSTFLATAEIIQRTADLGANLILTHEPTFYNHRDSVDWLQGDPVYEYKRELLEKNNIVVWRHHDYWHEHQPDGILQGLVETIGWENYHHSTRRNTGLCTIPQTSLLQLGRRFKQKLNLKRPFVVGDPELKCSKIGLLAGSWGARSQMRMLRDKDVEVLVVGEVAEWETSEYVRDAAFADMGKGLVILGHAPSEGPGMRYLADWLQPQIPDVPVHYEKTTDAFIPV